MKYTNKLNLPESFAKFYKSTEETIKENRYSVTELLKPTQEIILYRANINRIYRDIVDCVPALFGTAVHELLEKNAPEGAYSEHRLEFDIFGKTIVGVTDLLSEDMLEITDYKTGTTSKVMREDFDDFYKQGMMYALGTFIKYGIKPRKLRFPILLKDWSKIKAATGGNYPNSPIYVWLWDIQQSDYDFIVDFIKKKFDEIDACKMHCTDEERWYTGTRFAVYKKESDAKAKKIFDNKKDADVYAEENSCEYVEERSGDYIKCDFYCDVRLFCDQYRKEKI